MPGGRLSLVKPKDHIFHHDAWLAFQLCPLLTAECRQKSFAIPRREPSEYSSPSGLHTHTHGLQQILISHLRICHIAQPVTAIVHIVIIVVVAGLLS